MEVSFRTLLVALRRRDRGEPLREFPNTPEGHQAVLRFLARSGRAVRVCLESTGLYGLDLARTLHQAGLELMVANPRAVRHFATALMQRSKNDHLDAQVLCEFAARMPFQPWRPPSPPALKNDEKSVRSLGRGTMPLEYRRHWQYTGNAAHHEGLFY